MKYKIGKTSSPIPPESHTPPPGIRKELRKEVNFGCPVNGCGIPYLTYHHFDPPWRITHHQNPKGIIALCVLHANLADGGSYTKKQLVDLKKNPFLRDEVNSFYEYLRDNVIIDVGAYGIDVNDVLVIDGERIIGFEKDENGVTRLNLRLRNSNGNVILEMQNNDWIVYSKELFDFECSTRGKKLRIVSRDKKTNLSMSFNDYDNLEAFKKSLRRNGLDPNKIAYLISKIRNQSLISVWSVRGKLLYGWKHLTIGNDKIILKDKNNTSTYTGLSLVNSNTAISISNNMLQLGKA